MDSICRFVPGKEDNSDIQTVHFVYETELHHLKQPFLRPIHYVNLVTKGSGVLMYSGREYELNPGTLFFMFPQVAYTIQGSDDFEYIYISYAGSSATRLMSSFGITESNSVYHNFTHGALWSDAILRITPENANILTESVLFYTLSLVHSIYNTDVVADEKDDNLISSLKSYIDVHYRETDLSISKLSQIFSYSEKYLSAFFKKNMNIRFTEYLNKLRVQYATALMSEGNCKISQISVMCGYRDPMYFSKVFKRHKGYTPTEYIKNYSGGNNKCD